jgi:hypothetical protein
MSTETSGDKTAATVATILGVSIGGLCALIACLVLVSVGTIVVLALLGPAIGNVFSGIVNDI